MLPEVYFAVGAWFSGSNSVSVSRVHETVHGHRQFVQRMCIKAPIGWISILHTPRCEFREVR
jgi:hypothetical protein